MARRLSRLEDFHRRTRDAVKLIVVDLGFLGDTIHLIPSLWELKNGYAGAELHVISANVGAEILGMVPCVDRAWAFPLSYPSPPWWKHWDILRQLRHEHFDVALAFSGGDRPLFVTGLTGAPWRAAHDDGRPHFWRRWLIPNWIPRQSRQLPMYEQRRQVLARLGLPLSSPRFDLRVPEEDRRAAAAILSSETIHFSVCASSPRKEWPMRHWVTLARALLRQLPRCRIIATAGPGDRERGRLARFRELVRHKRVVAAPDDLTLPRLAALLRRSALHVGCDSGALHLAMALGIRTVSVFREYSGISEWLPRGPEHAAVTVPCECEQEHRLLPECSEGAACLDRIAPAEVAAKIMGLLRSK